MDTEKFPYEIEEGAVMDYLDHRFVLVIKDDSWNDEQIRLLKEPMLVKAGMLHDILFFIVEGNALDSADFYFDMHQSDSRDELLEDLQNRRTIDIDLIFLDQDNRIALKKTKELSRSRSKALKELLARQEAVEMSPEEYERMILHLQNRYEPFELGEFASMESEI